MSLKSQIDSMCKSEQKIVSSLRSKANRLQKSVADWIGKHGNVVYMPGDHSNYPGFQKWTNDTHTAAAMRAALLEHVERRDFLKDLKWRIKKGHHIFDQSEGYDNDGKFRQELKDTFGDDWYRVER